MTKYKITNTSKVDILIDIKGEGKVEDKVIIHPKTSISVELSNPVLDILKQRPNLIIKRV